MTVARLEEELSVDEFARWWAYFKLEAEERKSEMDKAKAEAKAAQPKRGRR